MSPAPSRRRLLGGVATAALAASAGCLGLLDGSSGGNGRSDDDRTLELTLTQWGGTLREEFVIDLEATESERDEEAFEAALEGSAYTTQYRKPFPSTPGDPAYAERSGTYYRLGAVVVDEAEVTHPVLRLFEADGADGERSDDGGDSADAVDADRLPDVDQAAVHVAHLAARARGNGGGAPWGLVQRGGYVYRNEERVAESELLDGDAPTHVRYRDRRYAVEITRERFYEPIYRATVEPVAESPERMEAILRATLVDARVSPDDLSADARDVLLQAQHGGYAESHPYSDAYRAVLRALHRRAYLDGDVENDAGVERSERPLLLYDGAYYDYRLRFGTAESDRP